MDMTAEQMKAALGRLGVFDTEAFPLYYSDSQQFVDNDGNVSGTRGSRAAVTIDFNNNPHVMFGIRIVNTFAVPNDLSPQDFYGLKIWDQEQTIRLELAQQNVIAQPIPQHSFMGLAGIHWHPFPVPYLYRGGNQIRVEAVRLQDYPLIGSQNVAVLPTLFVTLVTATLRSDYRIASAPGSTGRPQAL